MGYNPDLGIETAADRVDLAITFLEVILEGEPLPASGDALIVPIPVLRDILTMLVEVKEMS